MSSIERIVIVGAGMAGGRAAESLRKEGYAGSITLVGQEPDRPYSRPPLSKGYFRGEKERSTVYIHPESFYTENQIDFRAGTAATAIDPGARDVTLEDGSRLAFDRLLMATGAHPRHLAVPGGDLPGTHVLRTISDADAIRAELGDANRIVVIGGSWIACEVAASLRTLDRPVTLIVPRRTPLEAVVGRRVGEVYRDLHAENGVDLRLRTKATRILGTDRVTGVELDNGELVSADLVVMGVGVEPNVALARDAGLAVSEGVEVDATLESTIPGIFAAGDVAAAWHPFFSRRLRIEHVSNARLQGLAVGALLLGGGEPFDKLPSFYSDQYGIALQYTGYGDPRDEVVVRGRLEERRFTAFMLEGGRVAATITVGRPDPALDVEALIRSRAVVDPAVLADESASIEAATPA
jgi:3-phenylpropionate/trans-cinnamate dioxygenase ferredoxin reductase subunit